MTVDEGRHPGRHVLRELGFETTTIDDEMQGSAAVIPEMFVPGTTCVRTSILVMWTDMVLGRLAIPVLAPRVPTTLELDVQLYRPVRDCRTIHLAGRVIKAGRSVAVGTVELTTDSGEPLGIAGASFMAAPGTEGMLPPGALEMASALPDERLGLPLAERAGCQRVGRGEAVLPQSEDGLNSSRTMNGGLIALVAEEAALSTAPRSTLSSLQLRYLSPVRVGPAVARAEVWSGLGRIEVRDAGRDDRLAVVATTRMGDATRS